jgi:hypothetical protein
MEYNSILARIISSLSRAARGSACMAASAFDAALKTTG